MTTLLRHIHVYNSPEFVDINRDKVSEIVNIDIKVGDKIKGISTFGVTGSTISSPFSAPFGGPDFEGHIPFQSIKQWIDNLKALSKERNMPLKVTFPPLFYSPELSKFAAILTQEEGVVTVTDINYHIPLDNDYTDRLSRSGAKNLRHAEAAGLVTRLVDTDDEAGKRIAYNIQRINRESKGRRLKMSFESLTKTSRAVDIDYFIVYDIKGTAVASAICYHAAPEIVQVIYWGHLPESSPLRPVNKLAADLVKHYTARGIKILDIGPASTDGVPDEGLCEFKENIGCLPSIKYHFQFLLNGTEK